MQDQFNIITLSAITAVLGLISLPVDATPKTVQLHEKFSQFNPSTKTMETEFVSDVSIQRPYKVNIVINMSLSSSLACHYVCDGKTEYSDDYSTLVPTENAFSAKIGSLNRVRTSAQIDLILAGKPGVAAQAAKRAEERTQLDGKWFRHTTDTTANSKTEYWVDPSSNLPYRVTTQVFTNGQWTPDTETDFTDYKIDQPLPASEFTLKPKVVAAPDFSALTPDGKTMHLSDFKGKTVVLDFWATWCGPCQASMPYLEKLFQRYKDQNVVFLALCILDDKSKFDHWVKQNCGTKYHFPVAYVPNDNDPANAQGKYGISSIPQQFIVDQKGNFAPIRYDYDGDYEKPISSTLDGINGDRAAQSASAKSLAIRNSKKVSHV